MGSALRDKTVVVVGRGSGIARAVTLLARSEGARVVVAGRDEATLASAYDDPGITAEAVDITDDESIAGLADRVGGVDHVVSTASARARGKLADLRRENLPGQRDFTRRYRYRRLGRHGRRRQARLFQTHRGQQPGRSHRYTR
jgi:NADP-dependent 3-hydroxy acid dehydrogenase YdfG